MTRGDDRAFDHEMNCAGKQTLCGILEEDGGALHIEFGSPGKTSSSIVNSLQMWWDTLSLEERKATPVIKIKMDNAPVTVHSPPGNG